MARVIRTGDTPANRRRAHLRSCAEVLRLLAQRPDLAAGRPDLEAQDMAAFLAFGLRGAWATIVESANVWDDRGYWKKSESLRARWRWTERAAAELETLLLEERWAEIPDLLVGLVPQFADVTVGQITRDADWWCGALRALQRRAARGERGQQAALAL